MVIILMIRRMVLGSMYGKTEQSTRVIILRTREVVMDKLNGMMEPHTVDNGC